MSMLRYFRSTHDPATSRTVNPEVAGSSPVEPAIFPHSYNARRDGALRREALDSPNRSLRRPCRPQSRDDPVGRLRAHVVARALHRLAKIVLGGDVVAVEDRARPVAGDLHRHPFPDSRPHHVAHAAASEIVEETSGDLLLGAVRVWCRRPYTARLRCTPAPTPCGNHRWGAPVGGR